jgi:general secretion pathway protein G
MRKRWNGPYLKKGLPKDPWGRTYEYKKISEHNQDYDLFSVGADGQPGKDDVSNWE